MNNKYSIELYGNCMRICINSFKTYKIHVQCNPIATDLSSSKLNKFKSRKWIIDRKSDKRPEKSRKNFLEVE